MLTQMTDLPKSVIGFRATGTVTAEDYEKVLIPATEAALARGGKLRLLCILGEDFDGYALGAMWDDAAYGFKHYFDFERVAVVSDHTMLAALVSGFGILIPAAVRVFRTADEAEARAWLAEGASAKAA